MGVAESIDGSLPIIRDLYTGDNNVILASPLVDSNRRDAPDTLSRRMDVLIKDWTTYKKNQITRYRGVKCEAVRRPVAYVKPGTTGYGLMEFAWNGCVNLNTTQKNVERILLFMNEKHADKIKLYITGSAFDPYDRDSRSIVISPADEWTIRSESEKFKQCLYDTIESLMKFIVDVFMEQSGTDID